MRLTRIFHWLVLYCKQQKKGEKTSPMIQYVNADGNKMHDFFVFKILCRNGSLVLTGTEKTVSSCFDPWPLVTSCEALFVLLPQQCNEFQGEGRAVLTPRMLACRKKSCEFPPLFPYNERRKILFTFGGQRKGKNNSA